MLKKCMQNSCGVPVYNIHGIYVFYHKANVFVDKKKVNKYYVSTIIIRMTIFHNIVATKYSYIVVSRFIPHYWLHSKHLVISAAYSSKTIFFTLTAILPCVPSFANKLLAANEVWPTTTLLTVLSRWLAAATSTVIGLPS